MRPAQRRRTNDRFMRFDKEDRHQEKKLYANSDSLYDTLGSKLVSKYDLLFFCSFAMLSPASKMLDKIMAERERKKMHYKEIC